MMSLDKDGNGQERLAMLFGLPVVTACAAADRHCAHIFCWAGLELGAVVPVVSSILPVYTHIVQDVQLTS